MGNSSKTNFATNLRWIANIPLSILFPNEDDPALALTQFDIPEMETGSTNMSYMGYEIEVPTGVLHPGNKNVTFNYLLDSKLETYWLLYNWMQMVSTHIHDPIEGIDDLNKFLGKTIPITVYILDEYKKPTFKITYHDCWIKSLGNLSMSYQDEPMELENSFTIAYSRHTVEKTENN